MARLKTRGLVYVEWLDHSKAELSGQSWTRESQLGCHVSLVRSVGWVYKETKDVLTILTSHTEQPDPPGELYYEPEVSGAQNIIKSCIKRRIKLRDPSR